jgi:hypothetical protein
MSQSTKNPILDKTTKEADTLATRYWERAAGDREQAYKQWLNCLKKAVIEIKKDKLLP